MANQVTTIPIVIDEKTINELYVHDLIEKFDIEIIRLTKELNIKKAALDRDFYINKLKSRVAAYKEMDKKSTVMSRLSQRGKEIFLISTQFKTIDERQTKKHIEAVKALDAEYEVLINNQKLLKAQEQLKLQKQLLADQFKI